MSISAESSDLAPTPRRNDRGILITVAMIVLFIAMVLLLFANRFFAPARLTPEQLSSDTLRVLNQPRPLALATNADALINHEGSAVSLAFFKDKWSLVFFGFTHCPDICPTTLNELNLAIKQMPVQLADKVQVTLVSVDPARDSSEVIKHYVTQFNDDFTGITGDFVALKTFANSVSVPFFKVPNTGPHAEHMGEAAYQVDHGSQVVLINPEGNYHAFFKAPIKAEAIAQQLPAVVTASY